MNNRRTAPGGQMTHMLSTILAKVTNIETNTFGYNPYKRPTSMGSEYGSPFLRDLFLVLQLYPFREDRESRRVGRRTWQRKREGCPLLPTGHFLDAAMTVRCLSTVTRGRFTTAVRTCCVPCCWKKKNTLKIKGYEKDD